MKTDKNSDSFLSQYPEEACANALKLRKLLSESLPNIIEQVNIRAKMIAYTYAKRYAELICTLIPSKKGLIPGFNRGGDLPDPEKILKGTGKLSRYIEIHSENPIQSPALKELLKYALFAYSQRI